MEMLYYGSEPMTPFMRMYIGFLIGTMIGQYIIHRRMKR